MLVVLVVAMLTRVILVLMEEILYHLLSTSEILHIKPGNFYAKFQNTKLQVQANTSEPVGFMIGAHGMDDSCKVGVSLDLWWEDAIPIHSGVNDMFRPNMASCIWTAAAIE